MKDGKFTPEERKHLLSLRAVQAVRAGSITSTPAFKKECMRRYHQGERPERIFTQAGLPSTLIGYKRIERCFSHWKEAERKGALTSTPAPGLRHHNRINTMIKAKQAAVQRQRAIRARDHVQMEDRLIQEKQRAKRREQRIIAAQARQLARQQEKITALKAQVRALKALGTLSHRQRRAPGSTEKSDRFQIIHTLTSEDPKFNISATCAVLEVSRRGYDDWLSAGDKRTELELRDLAAKAQVQAAFSSHGFKKGSRQIVDNLRREQHVVMNRKKVCRIMRKYGIIFTKRRRNPYHPIGVDGKPKVAPNAVDRHFRTGQPLKVLSTDITNLPCRDKGFVYLSGVIDDETNMILAHVASTSMEEKFVVDTYEQLKEEAFRRMSTPAKFMKYTARRELAGPF